jgi:DNA processing protein
LWLRGSAKLLAHPSIAVVGTRHPTPYGSGMAEMLSRSGAPRTHYPQRHGAGNRYLRTQECTGRPASDDCDLGNGDQRDLSKENKSLAEQIVAEGGTIVSELPLGTFPAPQNFPKRNRILSGMSIGVLVVEEGEYSGTRVTARCALEQNRDVYAVPDNVTTKNSWGPNTLIKQGAKLAATWEDMWEDLPSQVRLQIEEREGLASNVPSAASLFREEPLPSHQAQVLGVLRPDEARQIDEIMEKLEAELSSSEIFTALFELELAGRLRQFPGKYCVKSF